eukprot:1750240-Ditylum_brightwellii.AAC.1
MTGVEEYKGKLCRHNAYINVVAAVKIFGLSKDAMYTNVVIEEENMFLEEHINRQIPYIKKVEETKKNTKGCWLIVCLKIKVPEVIKFIDYELPQLFEEFIEEGDKLEGFKYPVRAKSSRNKTIGSYVDALVKKYPPVQAYLQKTYNQQHNSSTIRRGIKTIMITMEEENNSNNNAPDLLNQKQFPVLHNIELTNNNTNQQNQQEYISKNQQGKNQGQYNYKV